MPRLEAVSTDARVVGRRRRDGLAGAPVRDAKAVTRSLAPRQATVARHPVPRYGGGQQRERHGGREENDPTARGPADCAECQSSRNRVRI